MEDNDKNIKNNISNYVITLEEIKQAREDIYKTNQIYRTTLLKNCEIYSDQLKNKHFSLNLKLENMQNQGSHKIRGIMNTTKNIDKNDKLVTSSAGNFGRSLSYVSKLMGYDTTIIMPNTAPIERVNYCKNYGAKVEITERKNIPIKEKEYVNNGYKFVKSYDDLDGIRGLASIGLEILEDLPDADIIIIGVGGGGVIAGVSAAVKLSGSKAKVYGVEPEGAAKMYNSIKEGKPHTLESIDTFVHGLAAPYAGTITYEFVKEYCEEIILVNDKEIKNAMEILYKDYKLVVEGAGAACLAAVISNKIDVKGKKVVCVLTGGNISYSEYNTIFSS